MRIRPEPSPSEAGLRFQASEDRVGRVTPEPPGVAGADELLIQAPAVEEAHVGQPAPVAVAVRDTDGDQLPERECRRVLLGALAVGLAALGGVDAAQPKRFRTAGTKDSERVTVGDADDPRYECLG